MSDQAHIEEEPQDYFRRRGRRYLRETLTKAEYERYLVIVDDPDREPPHNRPRPIVDLARAVRSLYRHHRRTGEDMPPQVADFAAKPGNHYERR